MRKLVLLFAIGLLAISTVTLTFAHAEPATVSPGDGAVLNTPPTAIVMEMSQDMAREQGANDIQVFDAAGNKVTTQAATIDNNDRSHLSVPMPSDLPVGTYTVKWKTLSADDGDAASGTITFTYDPSKPANPGKTQLRQDVLDETSPTPASTPPTAVPTQKTATAAKSFSGGGSGSQDWITIAAVGVAMFVVGSGTTFLVTQRRS
jgi:methionine-rich copper-binding protein CopC